MDAITGRLWDLVAELVPIEAVPSLKPDYDQRVAARRLAHDEPWTEAILRVMDTEVYRRESVHQHGFIARVLDIDIDTETRCLEMLESAGMLQKPTSSGFASSCSRHFARSAASSSTRPETRPSP